MWQASKLLWLFLLFSPAMPGGTDSPAWQTGEIVSRKTVPGGRGGIHYEYVYRVRGANSQFVVQAKEPLTAGVESTVKFAVRRGQMLILDADGREHRARILERRGSRFHGWR